MAVSVVTLSLAGCGGGSSATGGSAASGSATTSAASETPSANAGGSSARHGAAAHAGGTESSSRRHDATTTHRTVKSHDRISRGVVTHRAVAGTGGASINDDNPGRADAGKGRHTATVVAATGQVNPCTLVSAEEASSIVGEPIQTPLEAPLGPTCIYQSRGHKASVTLTVQAINFAKVKPHVRHFQQLSVQGRSAYCGDYGRTTTFVPLASHQVLTVTGSCTVGRLFAEQALPRLKA